MKKVTFNTDKLPKFLQATNRPDLTAYRTEILEVINQVGIIVNKGFKVVGVKFGNTIVSLPSEYLTNLNAIEKAK